MLSRKSTTEPSARVVAEAIPRALLRRLLQPVEPPPPPQSETESERAERPADSDQ
jgi:hypothetical protein